MEGGSQQGVFIGILEFICKTKENTTFLANRDKFKFLDDLTISKGINLLTAGLQDYLI